MTNFVILTLFTNMFNEFNNTSIIKRAIEKNIVSIDVIDIRNFTADRHNRVDFPPYGGGNGMIIACQPLSSAIDYAINMLGKKNTKNNKIIYMSPRGKVLNYQMSLDMSKEDINYVIICGHYEGIDERIIEEYEILEISIGDYILTGGELASQVLIDSVIRLIPGVLSNGSLDEESHVNYLLEYPQYTKPAVFRNRNVPDILLSGNHKEIEKYRIRESMKVTKKNRPDLYKLAMKQMKNE